MVSPLSCIQTEILSLEQATSLKQSFEELSEDCFFKESDRGRQGLLKIQPHSHRYISPHDSWFPVTFGFDAAVIQEYISSPFRDHKNFETIKKTVAVALKSMAQQMSWQGQTHQMSLSIMQHHHLQSNQTTAPIPWHRDNSRYTVVILLDDETKWTGGDFLFKTTAQEILRFQPKRGQGILFTNYGTQHSLESFTSTSDNVDRTILTLHEK